MLKIIKGNEYYAPIKVENFGYNLINEWFFDFEDDFIFTVHDNRAVQFINRDESRSIYASVFEVSKDGNTELNVELPVELRELKLKNDNQSYSLIGYKVQKNKVLTVVVSFSEIKDEEWARNIFQSIRYIDNVNEILNKLNIDSENL